ncbi:MAG: Gfo/Idh/MocA family oxidoreductase, partial [Verrucomicrobiales bacterium]|nr:Gfo/Idh/MocA family oxidoreductase [Verrucomicrobiales bacterium]
MGSIGERHVRCFLATGRCEVVICEPIEARRLEVAARYAVESFATLEAAVEAVRVDAAVVASPAPYHVAAATWLADRGIHLLIEKPLSLALEGVEELQRVVMERRVKAAVGFVYRALPALRQMQAAVAAGRFGRVVEIQIQSGQHFPFYRPAYRQIYYANPAMGGGLLQDMMPHPLNVAEWMVGPTTRVLADAVHAVLPGVTVEDTAHLLTRHGEVRGSLALNQHQPVNEFVVTVLGDRGAARWELMGQRWLSAETNGGAWVEEAAFVHERDDYYILQAQGFLDFLEGKAPALCSLEAGVGTLKS